VDATIDLPEGWVDRTVITYVGPDSGSGSPSLVLSRDELGPGVTPGRYAAMQDAAIRAGLEGVELVEERETAVAGLPAVVMTYAWAYQERRMRQRVWCIVRGEQGYAVVASASADDFEALRPVWARALHTVAFGD